MPTPEKRKGNRAPTLADVGRVAGVSAMAVSAVLNGSNSSVRISEKTQARIREAARELNYRPNVAARALVNRRMNTIGAFFVTDGSELNHYFLEVFKGIIEGSSKHKQNVTVFTLDAWADTEGELERAFDGRIDGMILIAPVVTREFSKGLDPHTPCVALHANAEMDGLVNIESDEEKGAYDMVSFLLRKGHRRIMHLSGPRGMIGAERRISGYQQALRDFGIEPDESLLMSMPYTDKSAAEAIKAWLAENRSSVPPDAIFCANDQMALGCIEALSVEGFRVPDDISVCGFDDTLVARLIVPPLTTVRQPLQAMGMEAVSILMKKINRQDSEQQASLSPVVFPTEIVERKSVADRSVSES